MSSSCRSAAQLANWAAPLASLDCSITEPLGSSQRSSGTDTPTLSGYFDCDQLSDMLDDSLFEITAVGCLSRSVFAADREAREAQEVTATAADSDAEPQTPTNEPRVRGSVRRAEAKQQQHQQPHQRNKGTKLSAEQQPSSAEQLRSQRPRRRGKSQSGARELQPTREVSADANQCKHQPGGQKARKFTFSLFNIFSTSDNQQPPAASQMLADQDKRAKASGEASAQQTSRASARTKRSARAGETHEHQVASTALRARDSIKLTNQRKQRIRQQQQQPAPDVSASGDPSIRLKQSSSCTDFPSSRANGSNEILLNLSGAERGGRLRPSRSSYSVQRRPDERQNISSGQLNSSGRQIKSVKFTMPDRVMILPAAFGQHGRAVGVAGAQANRQPPASIIKRQTGKSSSYSQTDSTRRLNEMLARYEGNSDLIDQISQRLKLSETIASPISALDQSASSELDEQTEAAALASTWRAEPTTPTRPATALAPVTSTTTFGATTKSAPMDTSMAALAPAIATTATTAGAPTASAANHGQQHRQSGQPNEAADPVRGASVSSEAAEAAEAAEAGFSHDWLAKQRAIA